MQKIPKQEYTTEFKERAVKHARETRLAREKKKWRKKASDLDFAINLRPLINELDRLLLHPLLQCIIL